MSANEKSSESDALSCTPPELNEAAKAATEKLLPTKSKCRYEATYLTFMQWRMKKKTKSFSENIMLAYFDELSKKVKPSTLWAQYSMLKSTINVNHNINLHDYPKLLAFLKRQSDGYKSKKSKVLTADDVSKFLNEAPDSQYLATTVALIFGITGACRKDELTNITVDDIENHGQMLLVKIPNTKTKIPRSFTVDGEFYNVVKKYESLRPQNVTSKRFFLNYTNGKCTTQVIGNMPKQIAEYLKLPDAKCYTGHSFRRTSATLLAYARADITTLKRHGGWKLNQVAKSYIEDSIGNKQKICKQITESVILRPSTRQTSPIKTSPPKQKKAKIETLIGPSTSKACDSDADKENSESSTSMTIPNSNISLHFSNCNVNLHFKN